MSDLGPARTPQARGVCARLAAATADPPAHVAILVGAVLVCYANALRGAFVFDDEPWIVENPALAGWAAWDAEPPVRRVAYLTLRLNHLLGGLDPFGYHLFNVGVHALAAVAVYALARRLLAIATGAERRAVDLAALAGALVFAVHPIQTQAVSYVIQRLASLAGLFYVAALALYAEARAGGAAGLRRTGTWAAAVGAAVLATFTKEVAFTLPLAVALLEASFFRGRPRDRLRSLAPFLALLPVIPWLVLRRAGGSVAEVRAINALQEVPSRLDYLATQAKVVPSYLRLLLVPVGQSLDHDVALERGFGAPVVVLSGLLLAAIVAAGALLLARGRGAGRVAGFGICLFFLAASVESSVVPIADPMNEHRVYLPSAGAALALAAGVLALARARPAAARGLAAAVAAWALVLGAATVARNEVWRDGMALWRDVVAKSPRLARGHFNLGNALHAAGDLDAAVASWRRAVELDPGLSVAWNQLGNAALVRGDAAGAEAAYRRAIETRVVTAEAHYNLGMVLDAVGRRAEAVEQFRKFVEVAGPDRRDQVEEIRARFGW